MPAKIEKKKIEKKVTAKVKPKKIINKVETKENNFNVINAIAIITVIALFGLVAFWSDLTKGGTSGTSATQQIAAVQSIAYDGVEGKNALELLREQAQIQTQDSSIGTFVIEINGTPNSEDHFWMFYVNSELAPYSADQYQTKSGDKIEWRYDQFN